MPYNDDYKHRADSRGMMSLFGVVGPSTTDGSAFIGRFQSVPIFEELMRPYAEAGADYDLTARKIKDMYKYFVMENNWTVEKYFRILAFALENMSDINRFVMGKAGRAYDMDNLPMGILNDMDLDDYDYVIGVTDESQL
jgi:hypothetical protein